MMVMCQVLCTDHCIMVMGQVWGYRSLYNGDENKVGGRMQAPDPQDVGSQCTETIGTARWASIKMVGDQCTPEPQIRDVLASWPRMSRCYQTGSTGTTGTTSHTQREDVTV